MTTKRKDTVKFNIESRLLEELGERLVSTPDIALSELIKNAYDADSPDCDLELIESDSLIIRDHGHGMTLSEFKSRWMTIATDNKEVDFFSRKYKRIMTGSKGIGRFAARTLGKKLVLTSIAYDKNLDSKTKLVATFDWKKLNNTRDLLKLTIPYELTYPVTDPIGTELYISNINDNIDDKVLKTVRTSVLDISSPYEILRKDITKRKPITKISTDKDPGFTVHISADHSEFLGPAEAVLKGYTGRASLVLKNNALSIKIQFKNHEPIINKITFNNSIKRDIYIDIRYFPRRPGAFANLEVNGKTAKRWATEHRGIAVFDKGFRVKPYGLDSDDWLQLDRDQAHSHRHWRSRLSEKYIPIPKEDQSIESRNPMVNLITNYQVVGAVFIESTNAASKENKDTGLIPSMDREGYIKNESFKDLMHLARFAVEYLTSEDKRIQLDEKAEKGKQEARAVKKEIRTAIRNIEDSTTLNKNDKVRIVAQFTHLAKRLESTEEYDQRTREGMEHMGFLGILAGFMTHEHQSILWELNKTLDRLESLSTKNNKIAENIPSIKNSISKIEGYIDYTNLFIKNIATPIQKNLKIKPRIRHAIRPFKHFTEERAIVINIECSNSELMPPIPIPAFEGIVLNLYSNAIKATINKVGNIDPHILIIAWSDNKNHYLTVTRV